MAYGLAYSRQYTDYYTYGGVATAITFEILWLPGQAVSIRDMIVSQWAERNNLTMVQLIIEEEVMGSAFDFDLTSKYRIEALAHDSPIPVTVIVALIAVFGVGVYGLFTWKTEEVRFGPSKSYYEVVQEVIKLNYDNPTQAATLIAQIQKGAPPPPPPSPGPIGEIGDLVKWGIVGLGAVMVLPSLVGLLKQR